MEIPTAQKEALTKDIERVEELRYQISSKTYDSLRKKKKGKFQAAADIDRQINDMRKEFGDKNAKLKQMGLEYIIVNKKQLNDLREKFMRLDNEEKEKTLENIGEGAGIIDDMEEILRKNFDKKMEIAKMILAFSPLTGEKNKVKEAIEGEHEFMVAELKGNENNLSEFFDAVGELGFICKKSKGKILICRNGEEEEGEEKAEEEKKVSTPMTIEIPGISSTPPQPMQTIQPLPIHPTQSLNPLPIPPIQSLNPLPKPQPQKPMQPSQSPVQPIQIQQNSQKQIPPMDSEEKVDLKALEKEHEKDMEEQKKREQELREKIKLNVAEMGRAEVEERMRNILTNPKMQRWVLNTFKDAAEREEYGKAQILLTALMKRKRELKKE